MTLNEEQTKAVENEAKIIVVFAGPGSGKTRVEVERAKWAGRGLERIAMMTFTNAGAHEFRERLGDLADKLEWCGTTHSYCFMLIQKFGPLLGYKAGTVSIMPEVEKELRLVRIRKELGVKITQVELMNRVKPDAQLVWKQYEFLLKQSNMVDYDLILLHGLALLQMDDVRARVTIDHLLVDETQDSTEVEMLIYGAIPATNKFFVGDPDQSIYKFKKADPAALMKLARCQDVSVIALENNYRSDTKICRIANKLISHNVGRVGKIIKPVSSEPGQVEVDEYEKGFEELDALAGAVSMTLVTKQSIGVLFRNNFEVEDCTKHLAGRGLPVLIKSSFHRPRDLERAIILLSLLISPDNAILFERYLSLDHSVVDTHRMMLEVRAGKSDIFDHVTRITGGHMIDTKVMLARNGVSESTINLISERAKMLGGDSMAAELIHDLRSYDPEIEVTKNEDIYVGTYHSAKGREWDVVFLPAFEQGIIPHRVENKLVEKMNQDWLEEERRLAFVAITRARHELYFSWSKIAHSKWGNSRSLGIPSQFLSEMDL